MDAMRVVVEAMPDAADPARLAHSGDALAERIKAVVGVTAAVHVAEPGGAPRSEGKAKRVVDKR